MSIRLASDIEKLKLFDQLFSALTVDEIKNAIGPDLIVGKLRNHSTTPGPIMEIVEELTSLRTETMNLRSELMTTNDHVKKLLQILKKPQYDYTAASDFQSMSSSLGVY